MSEKYFQFIKEILAIGFINYLAILYDSNYIMLAFGVDTMLLGFSLNKVFNNTPVIEEKEKEEKMEKI